MLGSQYNEVLRKECILWLGSRVDLLFGNAMGHIDIIEMKRPDTEILIKGCAARTWKVSTAD